jgi:hypothetical protein
MLKCITLRYYMIPVIEQIEGLSRACFMYISESSLRLIEQIEGVFNLYGREFTT